MQARLRAAAEVAGETEGLGGAVEENDGNKFQQIDVLWVKPHKR